MRFPVQIIIGLLLLYSCSNVRSVFQRKQQVYQPPRLGAESRFEDGLRREKKPQNLFSKKERKGMENMGMISKQERTAPSTRISPMQADSLLTGKTRDTTRTDSTQVIPVDTTIKH
ncbi:hypothetical protein GFS24_24565 [Chitinophaga sp. SYP-B3965]|uniref:hypothetical protein n=1 Tax=Chitinophaga sp. SYP-B3965 TaxID=2663120 RepID=UPI0012995EB8|nr:hypothetical protein [Chitinophaga sp. SYP-B3965]MRG48312.1 hypothetical protein [Chitinophaga sp. SYP-B3965]